MMICGQKCTAVVMATTTATATNTTNYLFTIKTQLRHWIETYNHLKYTC